MPRCQQFWKPVRIFAKKSRARFSWHRDSGSDFVQAFKSRSQIFNKGLGISASLGFYHLLPLINQNYDKIRETNKPSIEHWNILKCCYEYWKPSSLLYKVHRNSECKMMHTVQLQAWHVHCPVNVQIGLLIANRDQEFCYSFEYYSSSTKVL